MDAQSEQFEQLLKDMRPKLHRYCSRMTGSPVDGEDIVQEVLMKATNARASAGEWLNPQAWLMRVAHNASLDFLRSRKRLPPMEGDDVLATLASPEMPDPEIAASCLRHFLQLPAMQRSAVILKDVLDHSIGEIAAILGATEPAAKSALQRGRAALRALAGAGEAVASPALDPAIHARLMAYVAGFKAGDFDAVRAMLAEDVQLDLVARLKRSGKPEVGEYFGAYAAAVKWAYAPGMVEGEPVMLVYDREVSLDVPAYFVALDFRSGGIASIRDFLYARYAIEGMDVRLIS